MSSLSLFSLYPLVEGESLTPFPASIATLEAIARAWIDVLREEQIQATLWVYPASLQGWWEAIANYEGGSIYYCNHDAGEVKDTVSLTLPIDPREAFLVVKSEEICGFLIARSQSQERFSLLWDFESTTVEKLLQALQLQIAISDRTPSELLQNDTFCCHSQSNSPIVTQIFRKQMQYREENTLSLGDRESFNEVFTSQLFPRGIEELKTTLTHIKTALSLLESPHLDRDRHHRYLELLKREYDRQNSLINGMRLLLELDRHKDFSPIQLENLVPGIVSTYQPLAMEKGIQLGYTIPTGLPAVSCPSHWLQQIVIGLLNNSLHFTPSEGKISVIASLQNEFVQLVFKDTGVGIAPHELSHIFEGFYQGRTIAENEAIGAGLGLTLVQQLILRCGGSISVTSQIGKGSIFKVLLPIINP
ncbi:ATP-binding protein [Spirulina sp. 06S082]|uniref:ATP-binding protein n=1 Tax=Spirulina sp. 06S082 TaxID=3110248 RepID=UPI002B1F772D|nr:ATP-binding protein [Spirulina sp. 06S082]MEA5471612.1 ATP-binding protein [Spirulina sp. 06S082]